MSKIICDVCGTSYAENANQCPICGCVRSVDAKTVSGSTEHTETETTGTYTYVKGGRFSKRNVKKRTHERVPVEKEAPEESVPVQQTKKKSDKGLVITVLVLLLAIVAVLVYIAVRFLIPGQANGAAGKDPVLDGTTTTPITQTTLLKIPCEELSISDAVVDLKSMGAIQLLSVKTEPADTTDDIYFVSENDAVATVNEDGKIEAVGPGQTVITVTCGDQSVSCRVTCSFEVETTEPSTEPPTKPSYDPADLKLLKSDVTLSKRGETWVCYKGKIPAEEITWTSDNEKVATVENGKVTAVANGNTKIHGEYGDVKVSCIIRCVGVGAYVEPDETTEPSQAQRKYHLNTDNTIQKNDITLKVGESFTFRLLDEAGKTVDAEFTCSNVEVCSLSGASVTGTAVGTTNLVAEFDGETHICIVRVSNS